MIQPKTNAIYARQSIDKADSISIESQVEFCKYELKGGQYEVYTDRGYSGKNTARPAFQRMMEDIKAGKISQVVVYKLDRISRSILDFATMMDTFQAYGVGFVSSTEKFDTSTPMGRAMLNICIVFAQLERETIQKRVADAYRSRAAKGFYMGGRIPRGLKVEPCVVDGINTKKIVPEYPVAGFVEQAYEEYAKPGQTYRQVALMMQRWGEPITPVGASRMLTHPLYVKADMDVYNFFASQGVTIVNPPEDFCGVNGCYLYRDAGVPDNVHSFKGCTLVLAPGEGLIDSDLWLTCRKKMLLNKPHSGSKGKASWLIGKLFCGKCGGRLKLQQPGTKWYCRRQLNGMCEGTGTELRLQSIEDEITRQLKERLSDLVFSPKKAAVNPRKAAIQVELAKVEKEIETLLNSLTGANAVLISYANTKIEALDKQRQELNDELAKLEVTRTSPDKLLSMKELMDRWDEVDIETKAEVADAALESITVLDGTVTCKWRI